MGTFNQSHHTHHTTMSSSLILIALSAGASAFTAPMAGSMARRSSVISMNELMTPEKLQAAFAGFDSDGSGQVDFPEFKAKMERLDMPFNEMELEQMFGEMDTSSNGGVDADEFQAYVINNAYMGIVRRLT